MSDTKTHNIIDGTLVFGCIPRWIVDTIIGIVIFILALSFVICGGYMYWVAEESLPPWSQHECTVTSKIHYTYPKRKCSNYGCWTDEHYVTYIYLKWDDKIGIDKRCNRIYGKNYGGSTKYKNDATCVDQDSCDCWRWLSVGDTTPCYNDSWYNRIRVRKTSLSMTETYYVFVVIFYFFCAVICIACNPLKIFGLCCACPPVLLLDINPIAGFILFGSTCASLFIIFIWVIPIHFLNQNNVNVTSLWIYSGLLYSWICFLPTLLIFGIIYVVWWIINSLPTIVVWVLSRRETTNNVPERDIAHNIFEFCQSIP